MIRGNKRYLQTLKRLQTVIDQLESEQDPYTQTVRDALDYLQTTFNVMGHLLIGGGLQTECRPIKNTTKKNCYRALWYLQSMCGTNSFFCEDGERLVTTNEREQVGLHP